ncbi:hypothetical protein HGRIS_000507 [Hohenbuehelia grisea]|uniref:Cytochrome P450 n=1 Tax=Hohenbuehelia grisea TaxID=104357 RepID=A0ABR3JRE8_9AGAR
MLSTTQIFIAQAISLLPFVWLVYRLLKQYIRQISLNNIRGPSAESVLTGNLAQIFDVNGWAFHHHIADTYGGVVKIHGICGDKQLYISDPLALHNVVVKEQDIYQETDLFIEGNKLIFGHGLLSTLGEQHRKQRKMLNPVLSIAHMRQMLPMFYDISHKLRGALEARITSGTHEVDMLSWISRTAVELIGQSGLGHSFDSLTEDHPEHPYPKVLKNLIPALFSMMIARGFLPWFTAIGPASLRRRALDLIPWARLQKAKSLTDYMHEVSHGILDDAKRKLEAGDEAMLARVGQGKDIMSILLRANMQASEENRLTDVELLGQVSTLMFAAMDTTSGALARTLQLLAEHPTVQDTLRDEILEAKKASDGDIPYDELVSLPYLDAVCRETLRRYPPISIQSRTTRKDTVMPLSEPITGVDGRPIHEIGVPSNTNVIISIVASNTNPAIWGPDAMDWKPERWLAPLPSSVSSAHVPGVYSHLMTFLGGSRACIGFKFSQLEMKVVLAVLVETFRLSPTKDELFWNMTTISTPTVKGDPSGQPCMPLRLDLVDPNRRVHA